MRPNKSFIVWSLPLSLIFLVGSVVCPDDVVVLDGGVVAEWGQWSYGVRTEVYPEKCAQFRKRNCSKFDDFGDAMCNE